MRPFSSNCSAPVNFIITKKNYPFFLKHKIRQYCDTVSGTKSKMNSPLMTES